MQVPRFSTRWLMGLVAGVAVALGGLRALVRWQAARTQQVQRHALLAGLCKNECLLYHRRAETCRAWAAQGQPWDQRGEEAETLRTCPTTDVPRDASWLAQAELWDRAAADACEAAERHWRAARRYGTR